MSQETVQLRGPRLVEKVLAATLEELARVGYAALSIEAIAARALVAKTTVYRRWPTKSALVRAALDCAGGEAMSVPDTGSLRGDLLALCAGLARALATPGGRAIYGRIVSEEGPEIAAVLASLHGENCREQAIIIERAVRRRELPASSDPVLLMEVMTGAVLHFAFMLGEETTRARQEQIVDLLIVGARQGGALPAAQRG